MLARDLGRTLEELGETMSSAEFSDHWSDYKRKPWGDQRSEIHTARLCQVIASWAGKRLKEGCTVSLDECLIPWKCEAEEEQPAPEQDPFDHFSKFLP